MDELIHETTILITGGRDYNSDSQYQKIYQSLKFYEDKYVLVVHGGCRGADSLADIASRKLGFDVQVYTPEWKKYNKFAGIKRNMEMVDRLVSLRDSGSECIVLAFHEDINSSKGTKHCIEYAKKYSLPVIIHS